MTDLKLVAEDIIAISKKLGCTAQVTMAQTDSKEISLRKGEIEKLLTSVAVSTGVRLLKNNKSIIISFSGEDFENMETKIKTALESIDFLSPDKFRRLLNPPEFDGEIKDLDLVDTHFDQLDIPLIKEGLKHIETSALAFDNKIIPSETADFSGSKTHAYLFTTEGLDKHFSRSSFCFSYSAIAEENGLKETDHWSEWKRHYHDLPSMEHIGRIGEIAAEKAIKRLGGKKIPSGERKVVFSYRTAESLLDLLGDALDGEELVVKNSFLVDRLGEKLLPDTITVIDDPLIPRFPGSYPFDGEGMNGIKKIVIEKGKLNTYLHNSYSAAKLKMNLTGNASRTYNSEPHICAGNFYLQSGQGTLDDLVHEMKNGLLADDLFVSGINAVTGNFSFGCSGFLVENGVITMPVKEITIAGNILELYRNIIAIADDNRWRSSITSPSILVSKLNVAGT